MAVDFAMDNTGSIKALLEQEQIRKVDQELIEEWSDEREVWAVVVAPWILVQEMK